MDDLIAEVRFPIAWGATLYLHADGRVSMSTSEDEAELPPDVVDRAVELLHRSQEMRRNN